MLAAHLDAAIDETFSAHQLEFQPQHEIAVAADGTNEVIVWYHFLQRTAHQRAILDAPGFVRVTRPTFKRFAVKQ
jgi:hypothetical protein